MKIFDITLFWITFAPSYYWLMYSLGFLFWYIILRRKNYIQEKELESLFIYIFLWVILGWRFWYILFYNLPYYIRNYLEILQFWKWWMSFHWWAIWVIITTILFARKFKLNFYKIIDNLIIVIPIWLGLWRIGNYLNKELLWREYYWILCVQEWTKCYFPTPLLEMFFEWIVLYFILIFLSKRIKNYWNLSWAFLFFYGVFRFFIEFIRIPDKQIWYFFNYITIWQILSIPMIIIWLYFWLTWDKYPIIPNKKVLWKN